MANNGDTDRKFKLVGVEPPDAVVGLGSFHKTLPHNKWGEVEPPAFEELVKATRGLEDFSQVKTGSPVGGFKIAKLTNPRAGLAKDALTRDPAGFDMPPAPQVLSLTTAAEMAELYWMALLRDRSLDTLSECKEAAVAAREIQKMFSQARAKEKDGFIAGTDIPDGPITAANLFRMGLPGEEKGPLLSQFFMRNATFGTQTVNQMQLPYAKGRNYLTKFEDWLNAQNTGNGADGNAYPKANEASADYYEEKVRFIGTMRDLARFVNKDALHQAYFNATLLMLSGGAQWTKGNPYLDEGSFGIGKREAGFGTLGGPHILALVSEVATRALKIVWNQKWQVHLRLRPEAYGGLVHVQNIGVTGMGKRDYGLPAWPKDAKYPDLIRKLNNADSLLLPMAFTSGSPTHPAYGAGHATVAGACVTVLKAYFRTFDVDVKTGKVTVVPLTGPVAKQEKCGTLIEKEKPFSKACPFAILSTGVDDCDNGFCTPLTTDPGLTIEGELNKLASNVAMGRGMGGVHWRTDNTRSLILGEASAAQILAEITTDLVEKPIFTFRTFSRKPGGEPKIVKIMEGRIYVDDVQVDTASSAL